MAEFDYLKRNYSELREELCLIAQRVGVKPPTLVCVTKSGTDEELLELVRLGASDIGENRPGELARRLELIRAAGLSANMHEIGTLQRNKIKLIAKDVHIVHSLDSVRLAHDLARHAEQNSRTIPVLIEVNSAREEQKSGAMPEEVDGLLAALESYPSLVPMGLMTMGPVVDNPELLRPYFKETKKLFDRLYSVFEKNGEPILSMGMSDSYKLAIEEGSTLVRVGRRLFIK